MIARSALAPVSFSIAFLAKDSHHLEGQTLHAMVLGLIHPVTGEYLEVEAPLPEYFENLLKKFRTMSGN